MLSVLGAVMMVLCLVAYFTQRDHHAEQIDELKKDLQMQMDATGKHEKHD